MTGRAILLTGVAGFIGSHAAERFLARGDTVVGIDNFNDYYPPRRKRENLEPLLERDNFIMVEGDIRDQSILDEIFKGHSFSAVVHLAALAGVRASVDDPREYFDVNVTGTLSLLQRSVGSGQPNFVLASTSSAYGDTKEIPFVETDRADRPLAPYPASKRTCELLGHTFHHNHGLDFTALRFFTVYGPRNRPDMLPYLVMDSIRRDKEFALYEGGQMFRDWTFVDDIVGGIVAAADKRLGFEIINLGRGSPVLVRDFVEQLEALAGKKARWVSRDMPSSDMHRTYANIDKARRLLGYEPKVAIEEGVRRFFEWYEAQG